MSKEEAKNFINKAKELSSDDEMVYMFDQENMQEMIRNTELEEAIEKGSQEKAIEIAKNLLNAKMDLDSIAKMTGLSMEEIEKLK